ncbi:MAG: bifunctional diaminohydroxyphosphoribosylaminopyrimidine deaminase/5-amino-6-(5-phosphoribosylamino)uracil reductase RibD [Thermodesulfovibrionales bacterium]|nr:bifunctional diaminohydroxyphosphoribosylaminopyrimidine deaminase/5-amino-6-(5-phosphoribosylamino)uracil reductase RibD [Thermodesulfovibrionales bacterium]
MDDKLYIKRALRLAAKARCMTSPNPMVGAVIVKKGRIISEDFHRRPGTPHAEALAIEKAGENARGSTLYINLEPCCHTEKRTPPCTEAIISAGIKEVVIGMTDPNPKVSGRGILELQKAGIKVRSGILENKAERLNEVYIKYMTTGKPFVILKIAMTLDGKIATPEGQSKWITSEKSRKMVHHLRSSVDAVMTAIGTVKADDPQLTARIKGGRNPCRIIIDPNLEIPLNSKVLQVPPETIIVTKAENSKTNNFEKSGIKMIYFKEKLDLNWLMKKLGEKEITSVLIEAGSSMNAHALEEGIIDKVMFFIAPKIIGGKESFPAVGGKSYRSLEEAYCLRDIAVRRIGEDILIEGYIVK